MKTNEFLKGIEKVLPGTTTKGILPGSNMIVMINDELIAYNDRISVSTYLEDDLGFECAVDAQVLTNVVKSIKEEEIDISMADNMLSIVSEKTEAEIPVSSDITGIINMIKGLKLSDLTFNPLPSNFNQGIALTKFNLSDDYSHPQNIFCLFIDGEYLYASDSSRISRFLLNKETGIKCLIPKNNIDDLYKFEPEGVSLAKGWVHFIKGDAVFSCRTVLGDYPVNKTMMDSFHKGEEITIILPDELKSTIEDISSLYDETLQSQRSISINIKDGKMFCELKKDKVWLKKTLDFQQKDVPNISFKISATFLQEILSVTNEMKVNTKTAFFRTDSFDHVIGLHLPS